MTEPTPPVNPADGASPEQTPATPAAPTAPTAPTAPVAPPAYTEGQPGSPGAPQAPMNTLAIVAFIASFFISLAGIIMGHIALSQIKKSGQRGRGFALAGTIIGYVAFALTVLAVIVSFVIAGMFVSATNQALNDVTQSTEEIQSDETAEPDAVEEPAESAGERSAEFCDAFTSVQTAAAAGMNEDGTLSAEALDSFQRLADIESPNQGLYERFITFVKDPTALQDPAEQESLTSDYIDAVTEDTKACLG